MLESRIRKKGNRKLGVSPDVPLNPAPFRGPIHEIHHIGPVLPGKVQEFSSVQICGFFTQKSLKPPPQVGTLPRVQAIPTSNVPVVLQCLKHRSYTGRARSQDSFVLASPHRSGQMLMHEHPPGRAFFPNSCITNVCFYILVVFCFFR